MCGNINEIIINLNSRYYYIELQYITYFIFRSHKLLNVLGCCVAD